MSQSTHEYEHHIHGPNLCSMQWQRFMIAEKNEEEHSQIWKPRYGLKNEWCFVKFYWSKMNIMNVLNIIYRYSWLLNYWFINEWVMFIISYFLLFMISNIVYVSHLNYFNFILHYLNEYFFAPINFK